MTKPAPIGWCLCAVKNVAQDDPFWVGWVPITKREGSFWWFTKPVFRNRPRVAATKGYHFKLMTDFYREGPEEPDRIEHYFPAAGR